MTKVKESALKRLLKNESSERILLNSFYVFLPTKDNIKEKCIIFAVCLIPSYFSSHSNSTVITFGNVCDTMLSTFLAMFGIVFTGFIFFQALLNDRLLKMLIITKAEERRKEESKLEEVNNNFVSLMMLYVIAIIISLILTIVIPCIPESFVLLNVAFSNLLAWILIQVFYIFSAELMWRVLSFIRNIYLLFNAYAVSRIADLIESKELDF